MADESTDQEQKDAAIKNLLVKVNAARDVVFENTVRGNEVFSPEMAERVKSILNDGPRPLSPCPWCPTDQEIILVPQVACTNLKDKDEFQVWCKGCWAHGPSRPTVKAAVQDWNRVADVWDDNGRLSCTRPGCL